MKTLILIFLTSVIFFLNTQAQINYHITGSMARKDINKVYLLHKNEDIDSAIVNAGKFEMKGTYKTQVIAYILIKKPFHASKIILDNGEYNIQLADNLSQVNTKSTSINQNLWYNYIKSDELYSTPHSLDHF